MRSLPKAVASTGPCLVLALSALLLAGCGDDPTPMADAPASESGGETGAQSSTTTDPSDGTGGVSGDGDTVGGSTPAMVPSLTDVEVSLEPLTVPLDSPMDVQALDASLLVAERDGVVLELVADGNGDYTIAGEVVDLRDEVGSTDSEKGLLGLTTDPEATMLFVNHTRSGDGATVVASYDLSGEPGSMSATARRELVTIDQPFSNHNAGGIEWGPDDMVWFGTGDGGSGGDPDGRAQRLSDPLGKILRFDPTLGGSGEDLAPADNPYVDEPDANSLIWARGVRNPWRISFDDATGDLWVADVGQNRFEEISVLRASDGTGRGGDLGWDIFEGDDPFDAAGPDTGWPDDDAMLIAPLHDYAHDGRCSVTGGFLYRGGVPGLAGAYLFSDFCDGRIRALAGDGTAVDLGVGAAGVVSMNPDENGEALVVGSDGLHTLT